MPGTLAYTVSPPEIVTFIVAGVLVSLGVVFGYRAWKRSRVSPEERERQRRAMLVARGKMGDADLVELHDDQLFYTYDVRGVQYTACQDITSLKEFLPRDLSVALGPVSVKYDPKNPANSVVLSENWTGFRGNSTLS